MFYPDFIRQPNIHKIHLSTVSDDFFETLKPILSMFLHIARTNKSYYCFSRIRAVIAMATHSFH